MLRKPGIAPVTELVRLIASNKASKPDELFESLGTVPIPESPLKIVIVGGGMAGLCAAYELEKRGQISVILEAESNHVGGRVRTSRYCDGTYGELGAMRIPEKHLLTRHYVHQFNLKLRKFVQSNPEAYYFVRGKRVRVKDIEQLKTQFQLTHEEYQTPVGDMWTIAIVELLNRLTEYELKDLNSPSLHTPAILDMDRRSLIQLFREKGFSEDGIELFLSTTGFESVLHSSATEHVREEMHEVWNLSFDEIVGGMDQLPKAFVDRLRRKPKHSCEVLRLEQDTRKGTVAAVYRKDGAEHREEGDYLICTLPCPVLTRLAANPPFSGPKARAIRQLSYDSATKVLARADCRFWETDDGIYGGGSSTDLPTAATFYPSDNAVTLDTNVSTGSGVLLASYCWGQGARRLGNLPLTDVEAITRASLEKLHPRLVGEPSLLKDFRAWSWDNYKWSGGAFAWFLPGEHTSLHASIIAPEGRIHFAGEHASLTHTWIQGALESSLRCVREIFVAAAR